MSDILKTISRDHGCGDNSCMFGSPGGMATNGGCYCFDKAFTDKSRRVTQGVLKLRKAVVRMKTALQLISDCKTYEMSGDVYGTLRDVARAAAL